MKYIEIPALSRLAQALTHEGPECSVHTRIEAYSCKNIKRDKKLFKSLENAYAEEVTNLPEWADESTPFGPIDKQASRKTLYLLIATLNIAFPDYEFSDVRPGHFNKEESGAAVLNALSTTLLSPAHQRGDRGGMSAPRTYSSYPPTSSDFFPSSVPTTSSSSSSPYNQIIPSPYAPPPIVTGTHPSLYRLLDEAIGLSECEVFSYSPDIDSDPHANDFSDDDGDSPSVEDEDSSTGSDEDNAFEFDDYDIDEVKPGRFNSSVNTGSKATSSILTPPTPHASLPIHISPSASRYPQHIRMKRRGALLWSSHWFFVNRKLKRILFISVWARSRGMGRSWMEDEDDVAYDFEVGKPSSLEKESFLGWEGAAGTGARALGLRVSA